MIFESINYSHLLQDFAFTMGAGFGAAFVGGCLFAFLPGGKRMLFLKDIAGCFVLAVMVFSYVVSFANYPDIRIYHIISGFVGYLSFPQTVFMPFQEIFKKFFVKFKNDILCCGGKIKSTICDLRQKHRAEKPSEPIQEADGDLKNREVWVYNL